MASDLGEIMQLIRENNEHLRRQMEDLKTMVREDSHKASESRAAVHRRLDEHAEQLGHLESTVAISGHIDAQLRDKIDELKDDLGTHQKRVEPFIEDLRRMRLVGWGITGLIALAGLTFGSLIVWANEATRALLKYWLR